MEIGQQGVYVLAPDDLDDITGIPKMRCADQLVTMEGNFRIYDIPQ